MTTALCFQDILLKLQEFWGKEGCALLQPLDMEVGAGTYHPATTLRSLGPQSWKTAYVQPSRRPTDGRYGENPNRLQHYYQFQVLYKPSPKNIIDLYLQSLEAIGIDTKRHDIRFVEDDWENPTLGAKGLGWEVWCDGMEVTQFTYFQQVGGIACERVSAEITYGVERLAMVAQNKDSFFELNWNGKEGEDKITYGDVYLQNEQQASAYNFEHADVEFLHTAFDAYERQCQAVVEKGLSLPAYELCMKASHTFNLLDARGVISPTERPTYIGRVRNLARQCCETYLESVKEA